MHSVSDSRKIASNMDTSSDSYARMVPDEKHRLYVRIFDVAHRDSQVKKQLDESTNHDLTGPVAGLVTMRSMSYGLQPTRHKEAE